MTNFNVIQGLTELGFKECLPHLNLLWGTAGESYFVKWLFAERDEVFWNKVFK